MRRALTLGARLSPLHNRFPISIRAEALAEAASLTAEKVDLAQIGTTTTSDEGSERTM